nr:GDSL-type esterase/lipase family protein [uncultured Eisenbergiella sp.]
MKKYRFSLLLLLSVLLAMPFIWKSFLPGTLLPPAVSTLQAEEKEMPDPVSPESGLSPESAPASEIPSSGTAAIQSQRPASEAAGPGRFADTLFIGDSRTVGLSEYADLGCADVFASSGMSVYKLFDTGLTVPRLGKTDLTQLLQTVSYQRIYIMLGINELGYDFQQTAQKYASAIARIRALQPKAVLFLEANLHVTAEKSASDGIYNNTSIDRINQFIAGLCDGKTLIYVNANELFDDGDGNLAAGYTKDQVHVLGKYYAQWADWLASGGI